MQYGEAKRALVRHVRFSRERGYWRCAMLPVCHSAWSAASPQARRTELTVARISKTGGRYLS
jgi:hypothetical protein